jgi:hypothetical protein
MKKKFIKYPSTITATSNIQDIPNWISQKTYEKFLDKLEWMSDVLQDADIYLRQFNAGDDSAALAGYCGPKSAYDGLMRSHDIWEYEDADLIALRDYLWNDATAEDLSWVKSKIVDVYESAAPDFPGAETWFSILKDYGTFYID